MREATSLVLIGLIVFMAGAVVGVSQTRFDRKALDTVEELSESLADDLLDFSVAVRQRDATRISTFFADSLRAIPLPTRATPLRSDVKWIRSHGWVVQKDPRRLSRQVFLRDWMAFLDHFSTIEDVRFKVKMARFETPRVGRARVFFFVVGRDRQGHREWVRGYATIGVHRSGRGANVGSRTWVMTEFVVKQISSLVATRDLFSEVSVPAGVSLRIPAYGSPGNEGFVWHGAAAADVDLDGDIDVFATGAMENHLYLNDGNGRFHEAPADVGVTYLPEEGVAPLFLDYDNDGDPDLFISAVGNQMLLENRLIPDGDLAFLDISLESGVAVPAIGFSAVAGDVNGDGRPDIYVTSYNRYGQVMPNSWYRATNGTPNLLFVNQGGGRFKEMARALGVADTRWSYAAQFVDVDGDGDQDLYVANDFGENGLYFNMGDHFVDRARARGVLDPGNGMGVSFGDYDNDGDLDLFVTNMSSTAGQRILHRLFPTSHRGDNVLAKLASGSSLYENSGQGTFKNVTAAAGGFPGGWAWGGGFIDFDNDGWEDIYTPNGFISGKSMKDT